MDEVRLDQDKQERAKDYARTRQRLMLVELAVNGLLVFAWLRFGWGIAFKDWINRITNNAWLEVAIFAGVFFGIYLLIDIPLNYYSGFILPHRFGLSNQDLSGWFSDMIKSLALGSVLGMLVIQVIYIALRTLPDSWWLLAGLFIFTINVLFSSLLPVLLLPLFFKVTPLKEGYQELSERLLRLAQQAGTQVSGVFQIDMSRRTKAANAALAGLGRTRRIILGDTLINEFSSDEIESVFAHELGHQVHQDIPLGIAVGGLLTFFGLYLASLGLEWGVIYYGFDGVWDVAAMPLFALVMGVFSLLTMPLGNAYSRWRERMADEYALQATGNGEAYASALVRLANQNLAEAEPEAWVELLLYSHPALGKRIEMARRFNQRQAA